jgi:hypothetical protein
MNYKKNILLFESILLALIFGLVTIDVLTRKGLCDYDIITGLKYFRCVAEPFLQIISLFVVLAFIFLLPLYFLKEAVYLSWRKFALWYFPIVALILLFSPTSEGNGLMSVGVGGDRESLTFFFSGLFAFISLVLIIYKSIKLRGK